MSSARVRLRYRPAADVLSGHIDLGALGDGATVTESPDADTTLIWSAAADEQGGVAHYVSSFQFVHAAARLNDGELPLPDGLEPTILSLIATAHQAIDGVDNPVSRVRALAEASTDLPLEALRRTKRPDRPPGNGAPDRRRAAQVSTSLSRLADAVHHRAPVGDDLEALHTDRFSRLLRELSSTISHGHGRTAPGTSAATRAAACDRVLFTDGELEMLHLALGDVDDPHTWQRATRSLDRLVLSLERPSP